MTVTFASHFALWSSCDYIQPTWINQDNIPILRSIMESYLQTPFCPARWHGIEIWLSLEGHYSAYHRVIDKAAFVFISIMWFTPHPLFLTVFFPVFGVHNLNVICIHCVCVCCIYLVLHSLSFLDLWFGILHKLKNSHPWSFKYSFCPLSLFSFWDSDDMYVRLLILY